MKHWSDQLAMISGFLLFLMTIPHYMMGWPTVLEGLNELSASTALIENIHVIWIWSSLTMAGLGILLIATALNGHGHHNVHFIIYLVIGGLLLTFALIGLIMTWPDPHLSIFLIPAILAILASIFKRNAAS